MSDIEFCKSVFVTLDLNNPASPSVSYSQQINVNFCPDFIICSNVTSRISTTQNLSAYILTTLPIKSSAAFDTLNGVVTVQSNFSKVLFPLVLSATTISSINNTFQVDGQNDFINNGYQFVIAGMDGATAITAVGQVSFRLDFVKYKLQKEEVARSSEPALAPPKYLK